MSYKPLEKDIYWKPEICPDGSILSVDMVRAKLKFKEDKAQPFGQWLIDWPGFDACDYKKRDNGPYLHLWNPKIGENGFAVGLDNVYGSGAEARLTGFIEFNPNKLARNDAFLRMWNELKGSIWRSRITRFDLAQDFVLDRSAVLLRKGAATYRYEHYGTATEYSGKRNTAGFVKVYDKSAEQGFDFPMTRVEMTCDIDWTPREIHEHAPVVVGLPIELSDGFEELSSGNQIIVESMVRLANAGVPYEDLLSKMNRRRKQVVKPFLNVGELPMFPVEQVHKVCVRMRGDWHDTFNDTTKELGFL